VLERLGEAGRGFAVVADEVRGLAARTRQTTDDIHNLLESINTNTKSASQAMNSSKEMSEKVKSSYDAMSESFKGSFQVLVDLNGINDHVYTHAEGQSKTAINVRENIHRISSLVADAQQTTKMTADQAEKLSVEASGLREIVAHYSIEDHYEERQKDTSTIQNESSLKVDDLLF